MKILLINLPPEGPTIDYTTSKYFLTEAVKYPPLGLLAIAVHIDRTRHELRVIDSIDEGYYLA